MSRSGAPSSTNVGSGIATAFGFIPFNNQLPPARLSETRLSAQYSRLSLKVDTHLTDSTTITGYVESDFLGFQPANAYQTANSDSLRLRVYWADERQGKWEVLAGQEWSLLAPNRVGLSPLTPDVFYTLDEDPNFQVGLTWARQAQVRVVYHPTSNWAVVLSLENPQQYAPASVVYPSAFFSTQFDIGSGSTSAASSGTNTAVPNLHPDIIVKTAFDVHPAGHSLHIEAAGLLRSIKVLNGFTTPSTTNLITGSGGSLNLNFEVIHNLHLIANSFYSDGGGRYIFGLGPDVIAKPDGTLSGIHAGSGIGGFEYQATPHYTFYGYYSGAYFQRNFGFLAATPTSSCDGVKGVEPETGFNSILRVSEIESAMRESRIRRTKTVCTYCGVGCSFNIWNKDRHILKVDPWDGPANGISTCMRANLNATTSMIRIASRRL